LKLLFENWRKYLAEDVFRPGRRGLYLFDFDDTLAVTSCEVSVEYRDEDGEIIKVEPLPTGEFEQQRKEIEAAGHTISFDEFCHLGKRAEFRYLEMFDEFKRVLDEVSQTREKYENNDVIILTARYSEIEGPIKTRFKEEGISDKIYQVEGVEGGGPAKAAEVEKRLGERDKPNYDFVYFADDSQANLDAVGAVVEGYGIEYEHVLVAHGRSQ